MNALCQINGLLGRIEKDAEAIGKKSRPEAASRFQSLMIVDQAAFSAGFELRR